MKLELGCGPRRTRGYDRYNDLWPWDGVTDIGPAWLVDLPDNSVDEVLALAFIEHLTYYEALDTFRNVHRMLKPGGLFLFDVPDYPTWARYYCHHLGYETGMGEWKGIPDLDACRRTLFGWGRWPGDEHKYGWDREHLDEVLASCELGLRHYEMVEKFEDRTYRDRFDDPTNAHLYVQCYK